MKNTITCAKSRIPALTTLAVLTVAMLGLIGCDSLKIKGSQITVDQTIIAKFTRHTVTGITTPLPQAPDVPGLIGASYLSIGDLNNDGIKEIVATSGTSQMVVLYTWNGVNLDKWTETVITVNDLTFPNEIVLRDIDGDGNVDIMVMDNFIFCNAHGGIYYYKNKGGDITSPSNWEKNIIYAQAGTGMESLSSYHRAVFLDLDGDGKEDFITSRISYCIYNRNEGSQYEWIEWFKNEGGGTFSGPYAIGEGGGFMFLVTDINGDGKPDVVAPQFFIADPATNAPWGSLLFPNQLGASLVWFENPGSVTTASPSWKSYIIDYWYTSKNRIGKGMEAVTADIDNDNQDELLVSSHNHQGYVTEGLRYWPAGVFALAIPKDPTIAAAWTPITIDAGDPNLDPDDAAAVAADPFAVNRPGGPGSQGSPGMVRAADITGDGNVDIVLPGDGKGTLYYYEGQGFADGTVKYKRAALYDDPKCMPGDNQIVDIDGDGKLDIVSAIYDTSVNKNSKSGSIFVYKQN
jgi:hypothetical protein